MAKATLKATDSQGLGMAEQELQLQLVKGKQSLETMVMFTQYMQEHWIYCETFDVLEPGGFLLLVTKLGLKTTN